MKRFLDSVGRDISVFTDIFDSINDLVFLMEVDGDSFRYVYVNKTAARVLNIDEIVGRVIEDVVPKKLSEILIPEYKKVIDRQESAEFETHNGTFIGETSLNPILTKDGYARYVLAIVRDVTDRRRKEMELKETKRKLIESEQRYKSLFDNHPDAIISLDLKGDYMSGNKTREEMTGYSMEELLGKSFVGFVEPEDLEKTLNHFNKTIINKEAQRYEIRLKHKMGHRIDVSVMCIPIIVDEQVVVIHEVAKDITQQKRDQEQLIETKEELEMFWNYSVDPIFLFSNGKILKVNPAFEKLLGYTENEVVENDHLIIPSDMKSELMFIESKILEGKPIVNYETKRTTKSGEQLDIIASYTPVRDEKGQIVGATAFFKNVTDRIKAERKLQKSEEKFRLITENVFDIVKLINPSGMVEYVSPSNEKLLGFHHSEYVGQPFTTHIHPEDKPVLEKEFKDLVKENKPTSIEYRTLHEEGHWVWLEATTTAIVEDGEVKQFVTIARDITDRKKFQGELAKMAFYDFLTGLPNRRTFDDKLDMAIHQANRSQKKVAVMMLDGRDFKQVNDTFGHDAGDAVIKELANRIKSCLRPTDTVARFGGDEMAVIIPEIDSIDIVEEVADRIIKSLDRPLYYKNHEIKLGAGIGISIYPDHSIHKNHLIKYADTALYEAKELDHSHYRFYK
ncbi:PAS domain S-box protein [Salinibacillus xinjiangensis]|uniref:PAS domain S-box protein n=1 Tax=Salinibacillus xinjiangensis TaxID=1229268 RepID=A0A6G1X9U0_9BACI|nr:PAS domain S-box protein [Salinibacillus xinjiangensis]MRG87640.1 PAS domain S-box protein [Salinibacillus xinjiangensis]